MSDNHFDKFDGKFVDQAWAGMQELLEKELPVSNNKRRKVFFWWPFAGLGLVLVGSLFFYTLQAPTVQPESDTPTTPEALSSSNEMPIAKYEQEEKLNTTKQQLPISSKKATNPPQYIDQTSTAIANYHLDMIAATPLSSKEEQLDFSGSKTPSEDSPVLHTPSISVLEPLSSIYITEISRPTTAQIKPIPVVSKARKRVLKLGIEGGVSTFGSSADINAYGGGLMAEWSKRDSRWYHVLGLGYDIIKPQESDNEKILTFNNTALLPSSTVEGEAIGGYITVNSSISELRYTYLKFLTAYRITDKLATELGFMPSLLQTSTLTETWSHAAGDRTSSGDLPERTPFVSRITDDPEEVVNYNLSLLGGLSYQLNPTFSVRLQYRYGLLDLFEGQHNDTYLRGLNLSVGYYIR